MSKAIGNIFALGLAPEPNDEEKERLEQLSRQALPYLQSAKPLEWEDFRNSADKYREEMKKRFNEIARRNPQKQKFLNGWINRANRAHLAK